MRTNERIYSVDVLRGIAMILMVLDHSRHFFLPYGFDPTNLNLTTPWLFFNRWITHLAAPAFIMLAGMSIYFMQEKMKSKKALSAFLIKRGIWLIFLEITLLTFFWHTHFDTIQLQVIWVIGVSFLLMALMIHIRWEINIAIAIIFIVLHNLLDYVDHSDISNILNIVFILLFEPGEFRLGNMTNINVLYNIIPWFGIMLLGYCTTILYKYSQSFRKRIMMICGLSMLVLLILLRLYNIYGEPILWETQNKGFIYTLMSFLNFSKYPPSLQFLLYTIGLNWIFLALLDGISATKYKNIRLLGQTAMFLYIVHIPFIRVLANIYHVTLNAMPSEILFCIIFLIILLILIKICRIYRDFKFSKKYDKRFWWIHYL